MANGGWIGVSCVWIGVLLNPVNKHAYYLYLLLEDPSCACSGSWTSVLCVLTGVMLIGFRCLLITSVCCLRVGSARVWEVGKVSRVF